MKFCSMNSQVGVIESMFLLIKTVVIMQIHEKVAFGTYFRRTQLMDIYFVQVSKRGGSMLRPFFGDYSMNCCFIIVYFQLIAILLL